MDIQEAYEMYERGDHISNEQIDMLITAIKAAIPFLDASPAFSLVYREAIFDLNKLASFKQARPHNTYTVYDRGEEAVLDSPPEPDWSNCTFGTLEEAITYARTWLGAYQPPQGWQGEPFDYNGCGDMIEVKKSS